MCSYCIWKACTHVLKSEQEITWAKSHIHQWNCYIILTFKHYLGILLILDFTTLGNIVKHNVLQYSCLEDSMDRGASWATAHGVANCQTQLND